jgi:hypothetical protein
MVPAPPGKRDLTRVAAQVVAAFGEDDPRMLGVAEDRDQDGGLGLSVSVHGLRLLGCEQRGPERLPGLLQMIT